MPSKLKYRSKEVPLSLAWRSRLPSARDILMDPAILKLVHQLDFHGTSKQLAHFLRVFDSGPPSNAKSIRLHTTPYDYSEQQDLTRFLSSSFPELSRLDLRNLLPSSSSLIFTTSNLASLKLSFPH